MTGVQTCALPISDEYVGECSHVMAFAASTDKVIVESTSDSEDSSDDEVPNIKL